MVTITSALPKGRVVKPCPFCSKLDSLATLQKSINGIQRVSVRCYRSMGGCGAQGPEFLFNIYAEIRESEALDRALEMAGVDVSLPIKEDPEDSNQ